MIAIVDNTISKFAKYKGERYENGEQTLFYETEGFLITVTIEEKF